jgi:YesN/AraC family two-component response regulator
MKHKLLIVDDDPEVTQCYIYLLQDEYAITAVSSGREAVGIVKAEADLDLIVLDYRLEDISGIDALRAIRAKNYVVPVLFITGFGTQDIVLKAFKNGIDDFIEKPFRYFDLRDKILSLIVKKESGAKCENGTAENNEQTIVHQREKSACSVGNYYKIQRALKFIDDNFMRKVGRDEVAKETCMDPTYFSKIFKEVTGRGFHDYLNECRIARAKEILINGRRFSITEIALSLGFGDIATFDKTFKKKVGVTPLQYRNSLSPSVETTTDSDVA